MLNNESLRFFDSSKVYFFLNSTYYLIQLLSFFYISSIALPKDIGISSYVISLAGIFAVIARYGMPVYLIESIDNNAKNLDKYYKASSTFSFTFALLVIPVAIFFILINNLSNDFFFLMILGTFFMILFNPLSMIIEQLIILKKQKRYLSINCIFKTFLFPLTAFITYLITDNFAATIIFANISILLSPIIVYLIFEKKYIHLSLSLLDLKTFFILIKQAFPYFINSLALILILSIDKIFVGNIFSVEILGSYDLMWKLAILIDFLLMQPLHALFSRDIINISKKSGHNISFLIVFSSLAAVMIVNLVNFKFILGPWNIFFENYEFNEKIFKLSISFFILMFAVNQLRNLMANLRLRLMCTISSCIIPIPLIFTVFLSEISFLSSIPTLIVIGVFISLIFNLLTYNYFYLFKKFYE